MVGRSSRAASIAVGAILIGVAWVPAGAGASRVVTIASHISIQGRGLTFSGRVASPKAPCRRARRVTLYRTNGNILGSTTTGSSGKWSITASGSAGISLGRFYARVKRSSEGAAGTIHVCRAARSRTIRFH